MSEVFLDHVAIAPIVRYQGECVSCPWWSEEFGTEAEAEAAALAHEQADHPKGGAA